MGFILNIIEASVKDEVLSLQLEIRGAYDSAVREPKIAVYFSDGRDTRRLPVIVDRYCPDEDARQFVISAGYQYNLDQLFYPFRHSERIKVWFEFIYGGFDGKLFPVCMEETSGNVEPQKDKKGFIIAKYSSARQSAEKLTVLREKRWKQNQIPFLKWCSNHVIMAAKVRMVNAVFQIYKRRGIKNNRILFLSNRRKDLTGNFEFVYGLLKKDPGLELCVLLGDKEFWDMKFRDLLGYGRYLATSKVILVDDYMDVLSRIPKDRSCTLIQLWHACGAFKTFGFSRLNRPGGPAQSSAAHRMYDYAIVSSKEIAKFYAEGFGLSPEKVIPAGIPRTDIFFDKSYKEKVRADFLQNIQN